MFKRKSTAGSGFVNTEHGMEIHPDEIFLDASNLPSFDESQFEGRMERPIRKRPVYLLGALFCLVALLFLGRLWTVQVVAGGEYAQKSEQNRLGHSVIIAERGIIYDKNGVELAWNIPLEGEQFSERTCATTTGTAHLLGYVSLPRKDSSGIYYQDSSRGLAGVEKYFDDTLRGVNGLKIVETDALGSLQSESTLTPPTEGRAVTLSIDVRVEEALSRSIGDLAEQAGFVGGAGIVMDVRTGEVIALTSYPEFDPGILSLGKEGSRIQEYMADSRKPFLDRVLSGLYTPGSIIKPFMALAALNEGVIDPKKQILSTGSLTIPNPYFPDKQSVFRDWKAHGLVDMREALAVSSDVYFYEIGGGYKDQKGLGIEKIEKYARLFGMGEEAGLAIAPEEKGTIPNPAWKEHIFNDVWRLGDTYNTVIGQYGFQVTPMQMARAISAVANGGELFTPAILASTTGAADHIDIPQEYFKIVQEGMRQSVLHGTASGLSLPYVEIAAKTGTAEVGVKKEFINSWAVGFFPYENPRYSFVILMDRGRAGTLTGGVYAAWQFFNRLKEVAPEYLDRYRPK